MGKFDHVLLASDFDDTLFNTRCEVSKQNIEAIDYLIQEGGYFTVSTGRAHRTFTPYATIAPINAPVILANGALLYDYAEDRPVLELPLPLQAATDLSELARAMPQVGVEIYQGDNVYIENPNEYTHRHVKRVNTDWTELPLLNMPQPWSKAVLQANHADLCRAQAFLTDRWSSRYEVIFSNDILLECTAKGATKGGTVLKLAELLGVARRDLYCVGDNQNDLPMLRVSAIPFAPANCADAVRETNPRIVRPCDDHAIAHVVEILDQLYGGVRAPF